MKRVSDRPANTTGAVFVSEYHHIRTAKDQMSRSVDDFKNDLQQYYDLGFRPVLASEYLANKMPLPPGATPIIMTFDDANPTQLQLDASGNPTPDCAVGIWQEFAKTHPDFPVHATFFILPGRLWTTKKNDPAKVELLKKLGCELANHTVTHPYLSRLTDDKVKKELGDANSKLEELGAKLPGPMALPFGLSPKNKALLTDGFDYEGKQVKFTGVFLNGAGPARSPEDPKFNPFRVPRIIATKDPYGMDFWLKRAKDGKVKLYVSP